jgi:hypothetical protein
VLINAEAALSMCRLVGSLLKPEHVVPLVLHLAAQDAGGETGKAFDAVQWNRRHGLGGPDAWLAKQS